jgi:hypothetical protein
MSTVDHENQASFETTEEEKKKVTICRLLLLLFEFKPIPKVDVQRLPVPDDALRTHDEQKHTKSSSLPRNVPWSCCYRWWQRIIKSEASECS